MNGFKIGNCIVTRKYPQMIQKHSYTAFTASGKT